MTGFCIESAQRGPNPNPTRERGTPRVSVLRGVPRSRVGLGLMHARLGSIAHRSLACALVLRACIEAVTKVTTRLPTIDSELTVRSNYQQLLECFLWELLSLSRQ